MWQRVSGAKRPYKKRGAGRIVVMAGLLILGALVAGIYANSVQESESAQLRLASKTGEPALPVLPAASGVIVLPPSDGGADVFAKSLTLEGICLEERANALGRSWSLVSVESLTKVASDVLGNLEAGGFELLVAEKLDLFGAVWGCVASNAREGQVVLVYARSVDEEASSTASAALVALPDASTLVTVVEIGGGG